MNVKFEWKLFYLQDIYELETYSDFAVMLIAFLHVTCSLCDDTVSIMKKIHCIENKDCFCALVYCFSAVYGSISGH